MGYKGAPIAHLMIGSQDGCEGYLVGEAHQGLSYMFQMMNEARIGVGMNAVAIGTAAYYASLAYAKERPQGRKLGEKDLSQPQVPIIRHADVKRMLLFQKCITEGALNLILYCAQLADIAHAGEGKEAEEATMLLDLLTPIAKSYPSEMCCLTTSAAVQVLGGAGYTRDFPVEQYYREARIHPIHEGTTGIHGMDLLGRKVPMKEGLALRLLSKEIFETIQSAEKHEELVKFSQSLQRYLEKAGALTQQILAKAPKDPEGFLADATLYLEYLGILVVAWRWLSIGITTKKSLEKENGQSDFLLGKLAAMRYFYEYELVKMDGLGRRLLSSDRVTIDMRQEWF
jgi:butyryl-CoA dehydrogenase